MTAKNTKTEAPAVETVEAEAPAVEEVKHVAKTLPVEVLPTLKRNGGRTENTGQYVEEIKDAMALFSEAVEAGKDPATLAFFVAIPEGDKPVTHVNQLRKSAAQAGVKEAGLRLRVYDKSTESHDFAPHGYIGYRVLSATVPEPETPEDKVEEETVEG